MLEPTEDEGDAFATTEERMLRQAVERLKTRLPTDRVACGSCGYRGEAFRWGIKTRPAGEPGRVAFVLCCPGCEEPTDLASVGVRGSNGV